MNGEITLLKRNKGRKKTVKREQRSKTNNERKKA
jgi:hypothetical protein